MHGLIDQAKSLNGVLGAGKVIESVGKNMETDLESQQMKNIIGAYWDISKQNVQFVPVTGNWKSPYVYLNQDELEQAKQALNDTLAGKLTTAETDDREAQTGE
ncbi:Transcriptional regulator LytR [compost metagenome]